MRKYRERAVLYFGLFMLFMLVCTIVSRGIYAGLMPQIQTGTVEKKTLVRKIEAEGTVLTKEESPVVAEAGLLVGKVCVSEGQKVEAGDLLFQIETEDLEKEMELVQRQIEMEETKLAELNASGNAAVNRASQDLKDASDASADEVRRADESYQAAKAALDGFPSEEAYKEKAYKQDTEYRKLEKAAEKRNAGKEEKKAFADYKKNLDAKLSESYAQERQALLDAVSEKEQAAAAADVSRSDALKQAQRALEDAKQGDGAGGSKLEQQNQIRILKEKKEGLLALKQAEGKVVSRISGYVSRILVRAGERTTDSAALILSDAAGEKLFQAVLPQEEKPYVRAGDKMTLSFPDGAKQISGVEIEAAGGLEDGSWQITAKLPGSDAAIGDTARMEMNKEIGRYTTCIPLSALHSSDGADYVFLVEEQETILGTELTARRRKVKVLDRDEEYAALEDGALTDEEQFVKESDKDIKDGTRVRMQEM